MTDDLFARRRKVVLTETDLARLLQLPQGSRVVSVSLHPLFPDQVILHLVSADFSPVPPGSEAPNITRSETVRTLNKPVEGAPGEWVQRDVTWDTRDPFTGVGH